jgi:hypothetical protein
MTVKRGNGGLQFEEMQLGTTYSALRHLVVKSVTTSASRTAVRVTGAAAARAAEMRTARHATLNTGLKSIAEDLTGSTGVAEPVLEEGPPQWDAPGWLDETIRVEAFDGRRGCRIRPRRGQDLGRHDGARRQHPH